jgi:Ca2+/Na+ antiporter
MVRIINALVALLWLTATCLTGYLAYIAAQTERSQQTVWAWFVLCGLTFISASWLAYNIILAPHRDQK